MSCPRGWDVVDEAEDEMEAFREDQEDEGAFGVPDDLEDDIRMAGQESASQGPASETASSSSSSDNSSSSTSSSHTTASEVEENGDRDEDHEVVAREEAAALPAGAVPEAAQAAAGAAAAAAAPGRGPWPHDDARFTVEEARRLIPVGSTLSLHKQGAWLLKYPWRTTAGPRSRSCKWGPVTGQSFNGSLKQVLQWGWARHTERTAEPCPFTFDPWPA